MQPLQPSTWSKIIKASLYLALIMPLIIGVGNLRDGLNQNAETGFSFNSETITPGFVFFFYIVYGLRVAVPRAIGNRKNKKQAFSMFKGAIKASFIFEVLIVLVALSPAQSASGGDFSNNGWITFAMGLLVMISCVAQAIGMKIGLRAHPRKAA